MQTDTPILLLDSAELGAAIARLLSLGYGVKIHPSVKDWEGLGSELFGGPGVYDALYVEIYELSLEGAFIADTVFASQIVFNAPRFITMFCDLIDTDKWDTPPVNAQKVEHASL